MIKTAILIKWLFSKHQIASLTINYDYKWTWMNLNELEFKETFFHIKMYFQSVWQGKDSAPESWQNKFRLEVSWPSFLQVCPRTGMWWGSLRIGLRPFPWCRWPSPWSWTRPRWFPHRYPRGLDRNEPEIKHSDFPHYGFSLKSLILKPRFLVLQCYFYTRLAIGLRLGRGGCGGNKMIKKSLGVEGNLYVYQFVVIV